MRSAAGGRNGKNFGGRNWMFWGATQKAKIGGCL